MCAAVEVSVVADEEGRFIFCDFLLFTKKYRVICVCAPNDVSQREAFFQFLAPYVCTERDVTLLGDFNCVLTSSDRCGCKFYIDISARVLEELIDVCDLVDVLTLAIFSGSLKYTRFHGSSHERLDGVYTKCSLSNVISIYYGKPVAFYDHCLVVVETGHPVRISKFVWELWKLNSRLLTDDVFNISVQECFNKIEDERVPFF